MDLLLAPAKKRYFSREEIEKHSPSRKHGISFKEESQTRQLFCSSIKDIGMQLRMPQKTIASAMVLCHRFYMRQSLAKNSWQTMASSCLFVAGKSEDTPRFLRDIAVLAYELQFRSDPIARQRIKDDREVYDAQKEAILLGERILLVTLGFDLDAELPYAPLLAAVKNLGVSALLKFSWNYVNDWLWTTMCLQYKPHYIAAGSLYLAAKRKNVELPGSGADAWWMQFEVSPRVLKGVIQHMLRFDERIQNQNRLLEFMGSPESCGSAAEGEDGGLKIPGQSEENASGLKRASGFKGDIDGIRERLKRRKLEKPPSALETAEIRDGDMDEDEAWILSEIESGVDK